MKDILRGRRVLVLEDEPIIAILLQELIEAAGGVADCALNLEAAAAALAQTRPDLALLDINVHDRTSFELARRLSVMQVPVVFASGYGRNMIPPDMAQVPTVTKPYGLEEIERAFGAATGLSAP